MSTDTEKPSTALDTARGSEERFAGFIPGGTDEYGNKIKLVVGRHRHMVVYITENDAVGWVYHELPERLRPAVTEFQALNGLARATLSPKARPQAARILAPALYAALLSAEGEEPRGNFTQARDFILSRCTQRSKINYVLLSCALGLAIVAGLLLLYLYVIPTASTTLRLLTLGVAGGCLGAVISVTQRGPDLKIDPFESAQYLAFQGAIRVVLGCLFGGVVVVASQANIAFGVARDSSWALVALGMIAGFSERLIPDLLERSGESEMV